MPIVQQNTVVKGSPVNINDLFKPLNEIPVYQRDFVWQGAQVKALWNDLFTHYKEYANDKEELINPAGYFLGAMVVIEKEDGGADEIVDGQQRLTSLTTIAAVCYDKLKSHSNQDGALSAWAAQLGNQILAQPESGDFSAKLTFSDSEISNFFFESTFRRVKRVEKENYWAEPWCKERLSRKKSSFSKMRDAILVGYKEIDKFLNEVSDGQKKTKRLLSFVQLFIEGVIVLRIKAMSYKNAYAIFESLNNRGIPLSQSDLIKNEILKICDQSDLEEVADCWQNSRQTIESIEMPQSAISMPDFVHYSFISREGPTKASKLYDRVKTLASNSSHSKRYAEGLEQDAEALSHLTDSFREIWKNETICMLKDIKNVLNVRHCYPFLMAAYRAHSDDKNEFHAYVEAVMNFAFRYMKVIEGPLEVFSTAIGKACEMIKAGDSIIEIRKHFLMHAPDDIFEKEFEEASFFNTKLAYFTMYYLEKTQLGGTSPLDHGKDQNLEHIMPKTPTEISWSTAFEIKGKSPALFKEYLWRIGNLLPLTAEINKSLKNKPISLKIKNPSGFDYTSGKHDLKSPLTIHEFLDNGEWTFGSIEQRQKFLAREFATKAWKL